MQLITHSPNNALNLALKQVLQLANADVVTSGAGRITSVRRIHRKTGTPGLVLENSHDIGIVFAVLLRSFTVVQVDEHVSKALVQSVVNSSVGLLAARLLLGLLLLLVIGVLLCVGILLGSLTVVLLLLRLLLRVLVIALTGCTRLAILSVCVSIGLLGP